MGTNQITPPPGFTLDQPQPAPAKTAVPAPPPGFTLDQPAQQTDQQVAMPEHKVSAAPGGVRGWLDDLETDVRTGSDVTAVGKFLKFLGAPGTQVGGQAKGGEMLMSPITGPIHTAQGIAQQYAGQPIRGGLKAAGGMLETAQIPLMALNPEAPEAVARGEQAVGEGVAEGAQAVVKGASKAKQALWVSPELKQAAAAKPNAATVAQASKTAGQIQREALPAMQDSLAQSMDTVAQKAGIDTSNVPRLSTKMTNISNAYRKQAQDIYRQLDELTKELRGTQTGNFQSYAQDVENAVRAHDTYPGNDPDVMGTLTEAVNLAEQRLQDFGRAMTEHGMSQATIDQANQLYSKAMAAQTFANGLSRAEFASGHLKPSSAPLNQILNRFTAPASPQGRILQRVMEEETQPMLQSAEQARQEITSEQAATRTARTSVQQTKQEAAEAQRQINDIRRNQGRVAGVMGLGGAAGIGILLRDLFTGGR